MTVAQVDSGLLVSEIAAFYAGFGQPAELSAALRDSTVVVPLVDDDRILHLHLAVSSGCARSPEYPSGRSSRRHVGGWTPDREYRFHTMLGGARLWDYAAAREQPTGGRCRCALFRADDVPAHRGRRHGGRPVSELVVDPAVLNQAAQGITGIIDALDGLGIGETATVGRGFSLLTLSPMEAGAPAVQRSFEGFTERWSWGVRALVQSANAIAETLGAGGRALPRDGAAVLRHVQADVHRPRRQPAPVGGGDRVPLVERHPRRQRLEPRSQRRLQHRILRQRVGSRRRQRSMLGQLAAENAQTSASPVRLEHRCGRTRRGAPGRRIRRRIGRGLAGRGQLVRRCCHLRSRISRRGRR